MAAIGLDDFGAALAALSALGTAAFGLVDATKAFGGGVSNIGLKHIRTSLADFSTTLDAGVGPGRWWSVVRANWLNGVTKAEQKATVRAILKLGLNEATAAELAVSCNVDAGTLGSAARKLTVGEELTEAELNVLGRVNAVIDAVLDYAFEQAEQQYRNSSKVWAGAAAVALALVAQRVWTWNEATMGDAPSLATAIAVGLLAVPVAPVAKDLTSAISAAIGALKAARPI